MFCSPTANVIFYQGSSASGWTTHSPAFDRKLFENLMTLSSHRFAEAVYTVKKNTPLHQLTNNTCNRWLQITECTLGDPETSIFINHPLEFSNNRLSFSNNTLHFNTEEDSCNVCIMSKNNFGQTYYNVIKNVNQIVENNLNDDYSVCVTKFGFKPQLATIYGSGYIQNEHIGNASIFGDAIKIGSHVTEDKEYGPVEFKDGFCVIKSTNGCSILGGTTVKKGASVEFCVN